MKKTRVTVTHAVLLELLIFVLFVWAAFGLPGCATLTDAERAGNELCKLSQAMHNGVPAQAACDTLAAIEDWTTVANQVAAKPDVAAAKEALAAHPPIESVMPCSVIAPHIEPQSKLDRELYPFVVEPSARGE